MAKEIVIDVELSSNNLPETIIRDGIKYNVENVCLIGVIDSNQWDDNKIAHMVRNAYEYKARIYDKKRTINPETEILFKKR